MPAEDAPALATSPGLLGALPRAGGGRPRGSATISLRVPARAGLPGGMKAWRQGVDRLGSRCRNSRRDCCRRISSGWAQSSPALAFIALLVPLIVVTVASVVYFRYGRSVQYECDQDHARLLARAGVGGVLRVHARRRPPRRRGVPRLRRDPGRDRARRACGCRRSRTRRPPAAAHVTAGCCSPSPRRRCSAA